MREDHPHQTAKKHALEIQYKKQNKNCKDTDKPNKRRRKNVAVEQAVPLLDRLLAGDKKKRP